MSTWNLKEANNRFEANKKLIVKLDADDDTGPILEFELSPEAQNKLIERHMVRDYATDGKANVRFVELQKMAILTLQWLTGWENFEGEINKDILKQSCKNFPVFAEQVASGFLAAFMSKQEELLHVQEEEAKN